jgi:tetratricopeptide (TPR) repeat protein
MPKPVPEQPPPGQDIRKGEGLMPISTDISEKKLREIRTQTLITFGKDFLRAGRYHNALRAFDDALEIEPGEVRALLGRSLALTRLGRYEDALAAADDIFELEADSPHGYNAQAVCYQAMGRRTEAEAAFRKSIHFGPEIAGNHYNFACYWASVADAEQCRVYLTKAIDLEPGLNVLAATDVDFSSYRMEEWFLDVVAFK